MSATEPATVHLTQQPLSENDKDILLKLQGWLSNEDAQFTSFKDGSKKCTDKRQNDVWGMDLVKKVLRGQCKLLSVANEPQFTDPVFQLIRFPKAIRFDPQFSSSNPSVTAFMSVTPVGVGAGQPTVSDLEETKVLPLTFGKRLEITEKVLFAPAPALDVLAVTSKKWVERR